MNRTTKDIMRIINCGVETALDIQHYLDCYINIDYSECSQSEYETAIKQAASECN